MLDYLLDHAQPYQTAYRLTMLGLVMMFGLNAVLLAKLCRWL